MENADKIQVERIGGFGGFGLPSSHLKSRGEISGAELSPDDARTLEALFDGSAAGGAPMPDAFRYRLTRKVGDQLQTVEVPEDSVPEAVRNCVRDYLE